MDGIKLQKYFTDCGIMSRRAAEEEIKNGREIDIVEFEDFLELLGLTEEKINKLPIEDYEYLMDEKYKREKLA